MTTPVLHLVEPSKCGWPVLAAIAHLQQSGAAPTKHQVIVIGSRDDLRMATQFGVNVVALLGPNGGKPQQRFSVLRRIECTIDVSDVVHAWSSGTAILARRAFPDRPIVLSPDPLVPSPPTIERRNRQGRSIQVATTILLESVHQIPEDMRAQALRKIVIRPLMAAPQLSFDRNRFRRALGFDDNITVITPIGTPAALQDARLTSFAAGVVTLSRRSCAALVSERSGQLERAIRLTERHDGIWRMVVSNADPRAILAASDIAIWNRGLRFEQSADRSTRAPTGVLDVGWCAANGVSMVAQSDPMLIDAVGGDDCARIVPNSNGAEFAARVVELIDRPEVRSTQISRARDWARQNRDPKIWAEEMSQIYLSSLKKSPAAALTS